ncbi:antiviral reverse transcriptase Drt3b [Paenibacillus lautus]|uniref:antiviral reverse transcriptase Drt3b n=1 Tax=Paenibacillus lautus TaxID=1401 RepID=UPI003D2B92A3
MKIDNKIFILTDTLPYEIPLIFSNTELYRHIRDNDAWSNISLDLAKYGKEYSIPIQFSIWKDDKTKRFLSLVHPFSQLQMQKFIEVFGFELIEYCKNNSIFSVRYPSGINTTKKIPEEKLQNEMTFLLEENLEYKNNDYEEYLDSFFVKRKYNRITNFYKDNLFKGLEMKYQHLLKIDIKSCFDHIYTHSIDWAYLGGKELAKDLLREKNRFSYILDSLMQKANYNETNGIVVGPEFSRSVAEIVLQRIDLIVYDLLKKKEVYHKKDYEIVRFIDDIFIFSNNKDILEIIRSIYDETCKYYKLDINQSKVSYEIRPFLKDRMWVPKFKGILDKYFQKFFTKYTINNIGFAKKQFDRLNFNLIDELRWVIAEYPNQCEKIISYVFNSFDNHLEQIFEFIENESSEIKSYYLMSLADVLHYSLVFSITSAHVKNFIKFMTKFTSYSHKNLLDQSLNIIYKKCLETLKFNSSTYCIELNNLILFMRRFQKDLPESLLISYLKADQSYFTLGCIMFYLDTKKRRYRFSKVRALINEIMNELIEQINEKYFDGPLERQKAKDFMLSNLFLPIHDFFGHCILKKETQEKLNQIKKKLSNVTWSNKNDSPLFLFFKDYVVDFNKPFFKLAQTDDKVIEFLVLKTNNHSSGISGN